MKIAFFNAQYSPGSTAGGSAHIRQFIENGLAQGHEIWSEGGIVKEGCQIFSRNRMQRIRQHRSLDCFYHRIEGSIPPSILVWKRRMKRALVPVPHVWEWNTIPEVGLLGGRSKASIESDLKLWKELASGCDLSICVSQAIADYLLKLGIENCVVVPNGSDPAEFEPSLEPCPRMASFNNALNLVWIGSGEVGWHDFETIQKVAKQVHSRHGDAVQFHLIGTGIRDLHDAPANMHYHGSVSYAKLPAWLAGADVGIVAYKDGSGMYSSPLKLFDYMASGLSVISTEQAQTRAILTEAGLSGNVVPTGSVSLLVDLIGNFLESPELVEEQGAALRNLLVQKYTWSQNAETIFTEIGRLN